MDELEDKVWSLLDEASFVGGRAGADMAAQAVRLADSAGLGEARLASRCQHFLSLCREGMYREAVVPLAFVVARRDLDSGDRYFGALMFEVPHFLQCLAVVPEVSVAQILELQRDLHDLMRRCGKEEEALLVDEAFLLDRLGMFERSAPIWKRINHHHGKGARSFGGTYRPRAVRAYESILKAEMRCDAPSLVNIAKTLEITSKDGLEQHCWASLALPLFAAGETRLATAASKLAAKYTLRDSGISGQAGDVAAGLYLTRQRAGALRIVEKSLAWAMDAGDGEDHVFIYTGAHVVFALEERVGHEEIALRLPHGHARYRRSGRFSTAAMAQWAQDEALGVANRLDRRNGNDAWTCRHYWRREMAGLGKEVRQGTPEARLK